MSVVDSILDPIRHHRLIQGLDKVCEVANVPPQYVHQSMIGVCGPQEVEWVRRLHELKREGVAGLVLDGVSNSQGRCFAIAGALLRNFKDARVISLNTLLSASEKDEMPDPTILLIPNLYLKSYGKTMTAWRLQAIYDLLLARMASSKSTVVFVEDFAAMTAEYGPLFAELLNNYWRVEE